MRPYVYPCSRTSKGFCTSLIDPMNILHSGSWEAFRRVAVRKKIPEDILMMILLFIKKEQISEIVDHIRDIYIQGFRDEKEERDDEWICWRKNKYILESEEKRVQGSECHPGRFCLHPDNRIYLKYTTSRCGGYPERSRKKHLKLDKIFL